MYLFNKWWNRLRILIRFILFKLGIDKRPSFAVLTVTNRCNFRCKYCFSDYYERDDKDMSREKLLKTLDELADYGVIYLNVHGGEALLRKDIGDILAKAKKLGMFVNLIANGTLFEKSWDKIKIVDSLCISLDGSEPNNDLNRGRGTFKIAARAIDFALSQGHTVRIGMTITKHSMNDLEWVARWAKERNIFIQPFLLFDQEHLPRELWMTKEENRQALRKLIDLKKKGYPIFYSFRTLNYALEWPFDKAVLTERDMKDISVPEGFRFTPCIYKILNVLIEANGSVRSCNVKIRGERHVSILDKPVREAKEEKLKLDDCLYCYHLPQMEFSHLMSLDIKPVFGQFINQAREDLRRLKKQVIGK